MPLWKIIKRKGKQQEKKKDGTEYTYVQGNY